MRKRFGRHDDRQSQARFIGQRADVGLKRDEGLAPTREYLKRSPARTDFVPDFPRVESRFLPSVEPEPFGSYGVRRRYFPHLHLTGT